MHINAVQTNAHEINAPLASGATQWRNRHCTLIHNSWRGVTVQRLLEAHCGKGQRTLEHTSQCLQQRIHVFRRVVSEDATAKHPGRTRSDISGVIDEDAFLLQAVSQAS